MTDPRLLFDESFFFIIPTTHREEILAEPATHREQERRIASVLKRLQLDTMILVRLMTPCETKISTLCKLLRYQQDNATRLAMLRLLSRLVNPNRR